MIQCAACQTENQDDSRYCRRCASPLRPQEETVLLPDQPSVKAAEPAIGSVSGGKYKLQKKLGRGGMGVVYLAEDIQLKRPVAIKFLASDVSANIDVRSRFIQEAQAASSLDHQNICTVHEINTTDDGRLYIAMAYYDGETLRTKIEKGPVPLVQAVDIVRQVAEGVARAHSRGIVHRDLKPANIIVKPDGLVKIVDFGLAKLTSRETTTDGTAILGTVAYMSPEQAGGEAVDARSDLWSLGAVFFELLTGEIPFKGENIQAMLYAILHRPLPPISDYRPDIPPQAERIILKCLRKRPQDRYPSAARLISDLDELKRHLAARTAEGRLQGGAGREEIKETERRQATVLAADISGSSDLLEGPEAEEAALLVGRCLTRLDAIIKKYGGRIDKIAGGGFVAHFGIPQAIEDAPKKAVNAAIDMRNDLQRFNEQENLIPPLDLHVGINTGMVIVGAVGGAEKKEYSVIGEAADLAFALKDQAARGRIHVGPLTYRNTRDVFEYEPAKPVSPRGKKIPVPAFRLLSEMAKGHRAEPGASRMIHSEMVGREAELSRLKLGLLKVINGQGSIISISGEAGIGKSRLLAEFAKVEEIGQVNLLVGRALSIGSNLSYHPIIHMLKKWAGIEDDDSPTAAAAKLQRAVEAAHPEGRDEIFPFVATLMGMKLAGRHAERVQGIEGEGLEKLVLRAVRELVIKAAARKPLVLVLEDLHWADQSSLSLLESLYRLAETNRILFINIFRPGHPDTSDHIAEIQRDRYQDIVTEVRLQRLDESQGDALLENLLKVKTIPARVRELIAKRAEGNPFFIEEVARSFIDEGVVELVDRHFRVTDKIHTVEIPETIHDLIMSRVDKLDEETKRLLKFASVIGRNFFFSVLAEVAKTVGEIEEKLRYLKEVQLIEERRRLTELEYLFKHALARDAVYNSILLQKRKEIHLSVARSIESLFQKKLHEFYGVLALHYSLGEDADKAEEYLIKAGEEALKAAASSEAINFYQNALNIYLQKHGRSADPEKVALLEKNIAVAYFNKAHMVEAVKYLDRVLAFLGERRAKSKALVAIGLARNLLSVLVYVYLPRRRGKRVPTARQEEIFRLEEKRGFGLSLIDPKMMVLNTVKAFNKLNKYDLSKIRGGISIYSAASGIFSVTGLSFGISRRILEYVKGFLDPQEKKSLLAYSCWSVIHDYLAGSRDEEHRYNADLVEASMKRGESFQAVGYSLFSGLTAIDEGKFEEAEICLRKLLEIGEVYENDYGMARAQFIRAALLLKLRKWEELQSEIDDRIFNIRKIGQNSIALAALGIKAQMQAFLGDLEGAGKTLALADELASYETSVFPFIKSYPVKARFYVALLRWEESLRLRDARKIAASRKDAARAGKAALKNSRKSTSHRAEIIRLLGVQAWLSGKQNRAWRWWKKSLAEGERLATRPELARTYFTVGRRLLSEESKIKELDGLAGRDYLEKARAMFQELGLHHEREGVGPGLFL